MTMILRNQPPLMTPREAADALRCTERSIQRWQREGKLTAVRIGRWVRFRREDIEAMITHGGARPAVAGAAQQR
jgi:excisionase family DNA binding protein